MEEFKPNSHRSKEGRKEPTPERRKIEKVVSGSARTKKSNPIQNFVTSFFSDDIDRLTSGVYLDVIVPHIKRMLSEGLDMLLGINSSRSNTNVSYNKMYKSSKEKYYDRDRERERPSANRFDYNNIIVDTRGEAEEVLQELRDQIYEYGDASIAQLCDAIGRTPDFTDHKYGWTDLRSADCIRVREGYLLKFPRALPFD